MEKKKRRVNKAEFATALQNCLKAHGIGVNDTLFVKSISN